MAQVKIPTEQNYRSMGVYLCEILYPTLNYDHATGSWVYSKLQLPDTWQYKNNPLNHTEIRTYLYIFI